MGWCVGQFIPESVIGDNTAISKKISKVFFGKLGLISAGEVLLYFVVWIDSYLCEKICREVYRIEIGVRN